MTIRELWHRTYFLPRAAFSLAAVAAAIHVGTYFGLSARSAGGLILIPHVLVMVLGILWLGRTAQERMLTLRLPGMEAEGDPVPRRLIWLAVGLLVYTITLAIMIGVTYGEGSAEVRDGKEVWVVGKSVVRTLAPGTIDRFSAAMLRLFSAAWMVASLFLVQATHNTERRIRTARAIGRGFTPTA